MSTPARDEQREQELARGREIGARAILDQMFNQNYVANDGISLQERRRRDEYRIRMGAQVEK